MAIKFNLANGRPYTPFSLQGISEKAMRAEASRLRSAANKRIARVKAAGYKVRDPFENLSEVKDLASLRGYLSDLYRYLTAPTTLKEVRAARAKTIDDFVDAGFDFINDSNLDIFLDYLALVRAEVGYKVGSPIEIDYFEKRYTGKETAEELSRGFYRWLDPENKITIKS